MAGTVAVVHDFLNQRGGAERVALELARMWKDAPIYTSLYRREQTFPEFAERDVRTSYLDRLPISHGFRNLFPLYPSAFWSLGRLERDIVVSTSSGWAHGVRTAPDSLHLVYCHTPARWLYGYEYLGEDSFKQRLARPLLGAMRRWDRRAARRADVYVANSHNVRDRIRSAYGIDAAVVHPPVDVDRFTPRPRGERLLMVSRLLPYKRVDLAIRAANQAGIALDVIGSGPIYPQLKELAGPTVRFDRRLEDAAITELMESCRALILAGAEDFGITPVEALAAGKPVVAFGRGGALESLQDGVTAAFFHEPTPDALLDALRRVDAMETPPEQVAAHARRFSPSRFQAGIRAALQRAHEGATVDAQPAGPSATVGDALR
jgi:glycosyltransferase involved in cell wall biosynthesis